jgi:hypothetical protein
MRRLLKKHKIRPKANRKRLTPKDHPDRDTQFQYLQQQRRYFEALGWPIVSVDTKNKELIGLFKQAGVTWSAQVTEVYMHDFPSDALARAVPYGVYDLARNHGYIQLGQSADTPEFAVDAILAWWREIGQRHSGCPRATRIGRRRRQQWLSQSQLEAAVASGTHRCLWLERDGVLLSERGLEVEFD